MSKMKMMLSAAVFAIVAIMLNPGSAQAVTDHPPIPVSDGLNPRPVFVADDGLNPRPFELGDTVS